MWFNGEVKFRDLYLKERFWFYIKRLIFMCFEIKRKRCVRFIFTIFYFNIFIIKVIIVFNCVGKWLVKMIFSELF